MSAPLEFDRLEWDRDLVTSPPTIVIHSRGDEEIPLELTRTFVTTHPNLTFFETAAAPHGWEANADPVAFRSALKSWLDNSVGIAAPPS